MTASGPARRTLVAGILTTLLAAALLPLLATLDWVPHDEGILGMTARRVLAGEVPHVDFQDPYTGLQGAWHATLLRFFGPSQACFRWALCALAIPWTACLFWLASRLLPPLAASVVTLTALAWSLPAYFGALPSWYNLIFATFAAAALVAALGAPRARGRLSPEAFAGLAAAGAACGLSVLFKITGLYALAAGLLVLAFDEAESSRDLPDAPSPPAVRVLVAAGAAAFAACLLALTSWRPAFMPWLHFVLPGVALAAVPVALAWREGRGDVRARARSLLERVVPFACGAAAPVVAWLAPHAAEGRLGAIARGVLVLPGRRLEMAAMPLPPWFTLVAALPAAAVVLLGPRLPRAGQLLLGAVVGLLAALAAAHGGDPVWHAWTWASVRPLVPIAAVAAAWLLLRREADAGTPGPGGARDGDAAATPARPRRLAVFALAAFAAMVSLVQHPYAFGAYFCYAAPLVALAVAGVASLGGAPRGAAAALLAGYLAFGATWIAPSRARGIGAAFVPREDLVPFELAPVKGLRVPAPEAQLYETLARVVARVAPPGSVVYAAPDCADVTLLTRTHHPLPSFYDFFEDDYDGPREARARRILGVLDRTGCRAAVIHRQPEFSRPMDAELEAGLRRRFPVVTSVGPFDVLSR